MTHAWSNLAIVRASSGKRLWLAAGGIAVFIATVWTAHAFTTRNEPREPGFGLDFIAFHTAGTFVHEGRLGDLYDLQAVHQFQRDLAAANHFDLGHAYGPWWNPPVYALIFAPLARLPYYTAAGIWIAFNLLCFVAACELLTRMMPKTTDWKTRALVPVLIVLSAPFILAISHAQNTCTSLLLLTATVTLWRSQRALLAGLVGGLMFYKPQVGAVLATVLVLDLGWRALAGYAITGSALLLTNLLMLPGTLDDYLHRLPKNVHDFQTGTLYPWEQHVTLKAFWRLLIHGHSLGDSSSITVLLTVASTLALGAFLILACVRARGTNPQARTATRDRLIAATIVAAPLLMPFYFDYDLLLLSVPAVLFAAGCMQRGSIRKGDRWIVCAWSAVYVWQMVNTDFGARFHLNGAVPLLALLASLLIARVRPESVVVLEPDGAMGPLLAAA